MARPFVGVSFGTRHILVKWQFLATASVLAVFGLGFLARAVDLWLTDYLGSATAAAVTAALLVLTALAVVGISAILTAYGPKAAAVPRRGLDATDIAELAATLIGLSQKLDVEARSSIKPLTIAALAIGCAVGYSPALQQTLKDLVG